MAAAVVLLAGLCQRASAQFTHPGCLSTLTDLNRMAAKVAAGQQPWKGSWDILVGNEWYYMAGPEAVATVYVDAGAAGSDNYMNLARDSHRAYQCALRYHGSGNTAYADKAVAIMNAWASTHTAWNGNSNVSLRQGLYGYAFACAAELLRGYGGWNASDFNAFKAYMLDRFYAGNAWFLDNHYGRCDSHYWANWNLANMTSMLAIGVLCDDLAIFDEALDHFHNGIHTGSIGNAIHEVHPNGMAQWQEMGRDQGHSLIGPQLMGAFCEIAWNQGLDLYGHLGNRFLATVEHVSKYNTGNDVPYVSYSNCNYGVWPEGYRFTQNVIGSHGRGQVRPGWDLVYNHYVNRKGMAAPWTNEYAKQARPEGGGGNYGWTSGGFDSLGFTTLTHTLDPAAGIAPGLLRPHVKGGWLTLSWQGTAGAQGYYVKRSTTSGGPYTTIAVTDAKSLSCIDTGLAPGTTYHYVVSANTPDGETADSAEVSATHDGQLHGTIIGSAGSWGDYGAVKELAMDGSLRNFIDVHESTGAWVGLDLGAGVSAVVTGFQYCPRAGSANRMVGGKVQGSNTADFSSGVMDLFTIATAPAEGVLTTQPISNGGSFRYVRYIQTTDGGWNTVAEVQFIGTATGVSGPASAPGGFTATRNGYDTVDLAWNPVAGATEYLIKRSTTSGGPYAVVDSVTGTTYSDRKLAPGNHFYVVSALNGAGASAHSAEQSVNLVIGARYRFDGDTNNETGVFHGTATGSPAYATGQHGGAIDLDGTDDHVTIPAGVADFTDITVAAWVNWDGGGDWQRLFDFGDNTSAYMFLSPKTGGNMRFAIKNGGGEQHLNTTSLPIGQWTHVAVTLNGNTGTLYVNGTVVATNTSMTINPRDFTPAVNLIGKSQFADPLFNGRIDDFRVYGRALTTSEINDVRNNNPLASENPPAAPAGLGGTAASTSRIDLAWSAAAGATSYNVKRSTTSGGPYTTVATGVASTGYYDTGLSPDTTYHYVVSAVNAGGVSANSNQTSVATRGLRVRLAFDETSGTAAADTAPGGTFSGTLVNGPVWSAGALANAVDLDGANDHVTLPAGVVAGLGDFTIATWVRLDNVSNWSRVFDFGTGTAASMFLTAANGSTGTPRFAITTNGGGGEQRITAPAALATGTWNHLAVTVNGSTGRLYVNGVEVASNPSITLDPANLGNTTQNFLGKSQYADPYLDGKLDDFRIYEYALGASQIGSLVAMPPAPAAPAGLGASALSESQIDLTWTASAGAASYRVKRSTTGGGPYTTIATPVGTNFSDAGLNDGTTYHYVVSAINQFGESGNSAPVSAMTHYDLGPLPAEWSGGDIGSVSAAGVAGHANGVYTVVGSGADIWGTTDEFHFIHQQINGDCDIRARVTSIDNTDPWAKGGVMIRESLASGSRHANTVVSSGSGVSFQRRGNTNGNSAHTTQTGFAPPCWVRLVRSGDLFTSYRSGDGTNWTVIGTDTIPMGATVHVGLAVTSHNDGVLAAATFDNVSVAALPSPWNTGDIGTVGAAGNATQLSGTFTVAGSGSDIWATADGFRYVYQDAGGDCEIVARVTSVGNTHNWAKAGVMIRETLAANSRHAMVVVTPGQGVSFQRRTGTGGASASTTTSGLAAPHWVRLVRSGDTFTAYRSTDGANWTTIGTQTISMSTNVYLGLAVTSHADGTLCTSTFGNVTATP